MSSWFVFRCYSDPEESATNPDPEDADYMSCCMNCSKGTDEDFAECIMECVKKYPDEDEE